jgi:hypothetical protein
MKVRPPREALEYELSGEGATSLGLAGEKLERALAILRAFDAATSATAVSAPTARAELVADAAERLWIYIVQREAMGLTHHEKTLELFGVPREIRWRMGPRPRGKKI